MRRVLTPLAWALAAAASLVVFVAAGRWSASPISWSDVGGWLNSTTRADMVVELARWVGVVLSAYVLAVSLLVVSAETAAALRWLSLARALRWVGERSAVPVLRRRLMKATAASAFSVSSLAVSTAGMATAAGSPPAELVEESFDPAGLPDGLTVDAFAGFKVKAAAATVDRSERKPASLPPTDPASWAAHTVVEGDTLWEILEDRYGRVDADMVWQAAADNDLADPSELAVSAVLYLRPYESGQPRGDHAGSRSYRVVVEPGDTLSGLIERYGPRGLAAGEVARVAAKNHGTATPDGVFVFDAATPDLVHPGQEFDLSADVAQPPDRPPPQDPPRDERPLDSPPDRRPPDRREPPVIEAPTVTPPPPIVSVPATPARLRPTMPPPMTAGSPSPGSVAVPATSPPSARPVQEPTVASEDMLSSRWLFGGVAATSLGLVGAWRTLKRMRRRRCRWLGLDRSSSVTSSSTDREREALGDVEMLRELVDVDLDRWPVRAVLLGGQPEIWFRDAPPPVPTGWELFDRGWRRIDGDAPVSPVGVLSPALVTIGRGTGGSDVLLDLLSAGTVSVTGDRLVVERLVCSMLWELAADPLGGHVDLRVVGLACAAARHATNACRVVSLDEAISAATVPGDGPQVFLVDPFAAGPATGNLGDLIESCEPGSGRAVVVAGPCEHPVEQISVPSADRVLWDELTLAGPQLPEFVDVELDRMFAAVEVGRRDSTAAALRVTPDPQADAVASGSTLTAAAVDCVDVDADELFESAGADGTSDDGPAPSPADALEPVQVDVPVELRAVVLAVCGREVTVQGYPVPQAAAVLFVLAAAGGEMHSSELSELTGYAAKSLSTVFTASHDLVERRDGSLRLAGHVWTDHAWATNCVAQLAAALGDDAGSPEATRWMLAAFEAIGALEQAPFAVLPSGRGHSNRSAWGWVDEFPATVTARAAAETEVVEAALAFSELWLAAPDGQRVVRREDLVAELCRLAATVPFAHVARQLRDSMWVTGAECLLTAAVRVAGDDDTLRGRVQQAARALAAREQVEASNELADELGL